MKKLLLLIVTIISALNASAQEIDSSLVQSADIPIDSLSIRLNKLQHDYDFMYCDYVLHKLLMDLKDLSHSIGSSSNGVLINFFNSRYDHALYNSYLVSYDAYSALLNSLKESIETTQMAVLIKEASSGFSDAELSVLGSSLNTINKAVTSVEASLNYFDATIKAYRSKR